MQTQKALCKHKKTLCKRQKAFCKQMKALCKRIEALCKHKKALYKYFYKIYATKQYTKQDVKHVNILGFGATQVAVATLDSCLAEFICVYH